MKYQLIACDLDETLLNSQHTICQRNIDLIQKAKGLSLFLQQEDYILLLKMF